MSDDDDADCVEHVWVVRTATFADDGGHVASICTRCGALLVETPDQLTGRAP